MSPDGRRVGFLEHPLFGDNRGYVAVYDGKAVRRLTPEYSGTEALAWSADGREIWYGGATTEASWPIKAIDPDTTVPRDGRMVWYVPSNLLLLDIDARGRVLLTGNEAGGVTAGASAGDARDRDLSWGGWSMPGHVSRDGHTVLLSGQDGTDPDYSVSPAAHGRLGAGQDRSRAARRQLSPDGKWALSITPSEPNRVLLLPTGAGEPRQIDVGDLAPNAAVFVAPESEGRRRRHPQRISRRGRRRRLVRHAQQPRPSGASRTGIQRAPVSCATHTSPDGSLLAVQADDGKVLAWPLPHGGPARELATLGEQRRLRWLVGQARAHLRRHLERTEGAHRLARRQHPPARDALRDHRGRSRRHC